MTAIAASYNPVLHLPDGTEIHNLDLSYATAEFRVGEVLILQRKIGRELYQVESVEHQLKEVDNGFLKLILTNVILVDAAP